MLYSPVYAADVTTLTLYEKDSVDTSNYPLTFGHIFKDGDVADYVAVRYNDTVLTTQCDVKARYASGNLKFAVISIVLPSIVADSTNTIVLETTASTSSSGFMDAGSFLATNIEDEIRLTNLSGCGYSGSVTADLNAEIDTGDFDYWLQGPVVTEVTVTEELNNNLGATWEVRFYPGTGFGPRISHSIENMNADSRGLVSYDLDIQAGQPTLSSRYTKTSFDHEGNTRWRKVLWIGTEPAETELHYDISYMISTGAVMNYDTSLVIPESRLASEYSGWSSSAHDIGDTSFITPHFNTSGARQEIGPLPEWTTRYLLSFDNRMKEIMLNIGELMAICPCHWREYDSGNTWFEKPISIDDRPGVKTMEYDVAGLPAAVGDTSTTMSIDRAHQPSFNFIPYIITGEKFHLDEMYYWASWNLSAYSVGADYRNYDEGILSDQARGEAWALRNIADAAWISEHNSLEKKYYDSKITNNINKWMTEQDRYPLNYWWVDIYGPLSGLDTDVTRYSGATAQENFMMLMLVHAKDLGYATGQIIDWYQVYHIGLTEVMDNPYLCCDYKYPAELHTGYPTTWGEWKSGYINQNPTSFGTLVYENRVEQRMAVMSQLTQYANGQAAYDWIKKEVDTNKNYDRNEYPKWALLPRISCAPKPPSGLRAANQAVSPRKAIFQHVRK